MTRPAMAILAMVCLAGCSWSDSEPSDQGNVDAQPTQETSFSLLGTSWTYPGEDGVTILETIDTSGNYVSTQGSTIVDRGTVEMVNGHACFDSTGSDSPPNCWRIPEVEIGDTREYVDNHGQRLSVTRVAHVSR